MKPSTAGSRPAASSPPSDGAAKSARGDLASLASGWLLTLVGVVSSAVFGFAFSIVIARGLGAHDAGVFFSTLAIFVIGMSVAQFGAPAATVRMLSRFRALDQVDKLRPTLAVALSPTLGVSVVLAVALFLFAPQLSDALLGGAEADAATPYFRVLAPFLPLAVGYELVISATRGMGSMVPYVAIGNLGIASARPILALAAITSGLGSAALALAWAVPQAIGLLIAAWVLLGLLRKVERRAGSAPAARPLGALTSEFWRFTVPLGVAGILQIVLLWLDTILLTALASPSDAGIYKTAGSFILQGTFAQQAIILVIGPLLSGLLAQAHYDRAQSVYQTGTWWITALAWPIFITLAVFAPVLMRLFGPDFVAGQTPLRILALTMLIAMAAGPVTAALVMSGRSSWNLVNTAACVALNVALNLILIPPYGMTGAALAWAASILLGNLAPGLQVWHFLKLYPLGAGFSIVGLGAAACYGGLGVVFWLALGQTPVALLTSVVAASALYLVVLWRFRTTLRLSFLRDSLRLRRVGAGLEPA